ncbi:MAG: manganese efflux pump [Lachnospiraceae bacterium]|nr:manganese efflux pump [Lachnospiraceae bacterium]
MDVISFFLLGVGLAMDALAVSVCKGLAMTKVNKKQCLVIALYFGGFQALMPFIGWSVGMTFAKYIMKYDHWIAFLLLLYIGGKMIVEAIREWNEEIKVDKMDVSLDHKEMLMLAIATSIDALAVGVTFSFEPQTNIWIAISIIGIITFFISGAGVFIGNIFGAKFEKKAQVIGGSILIFIGARILVEGLLGL